ncbi:hypothetical protein D3C84_552580 [compost metagenome]
MPLHPDGVVGGAIARDLVAGGERLEGQAGAEGNAEPHADGDLVALIPHHVDPQGAIEGEILAHLGIDLGRLVVELAEDLHLEAVLGRDGQGNAGEAIEIRVVEIAVGDLGGEVGLLIEGAEVALDELIGLLRQTQQIVRHFKTHPGQGGLGQQGTGDKGESRQC